MSESDKCAQPEFPKRECFSCGYKTRSTSTVDYCPRCHDTKGLRPSWAELMLPKKEGVQS